MNSRQGIALVTALVVMVVVSLLVFGSFFTTQIELWVTRNDTTSTQANYVAQAGLQKYKSAMFQYYRWIESMDSTSVNPQRSVCFNRMGGGIDWQRSGTKIQWSGLQMGPFTETVTDASGAVIGSYQVTLFRDPTINHYFTIQSVGSSGNAQSTVRATFEVRNSGILEQAIFAGRGQGNKFINGGATIRGGIYVVGDSPDALVFEANGNFSLLNHYNLNSYGSNVAGRVATDNRIASNLCASLRVQKGKVEVGGSTQIGEPDNKLLGVFVGRGASDVSGNSSSVCQSNKGVCTDQGPSAFDLDNPPSFPTLDGPPNPDECALSTWRACIAQAATRPGQGLRVERVAGVPVISFPAGAVISNATGCAAALSGETLTLNTQSFDCTYTLNGMTGGFRYTGNTTPATLEVYGNVNLKGFNLTLSKNSDYVARSYKLESNGTVTTTHNASLVLERSSPTSTSNGNLDLDGNLLPRTTGGNPHFPDHVLGLVAEGDVYQGGDYVMSPLYSGGTFRIEKDNVLFGSVVTNMFCTTSAGKGSNCNAGQKAEVVYVNTGTNKPAIMKQIEKSGIPTFKVLSYERR